MHIYTRGEYYTFSSLGIENMKKSYIRGILIFRFRIQNTRNPESIQILAYLHIVLFSPFTFFISYLVESTKQLPPSLIFFSFQSCPSFQFLSVPSQLLVPFSPVPAFSSFQSHPSSQFLSVLSQLLVPFSPIPALSSFQYYPSFQILSVPSQLLDPFSPIPAVRSS